MLRLTVRDVPFYFKINVRLVIKSSYTEDDDILGKTNEINIMLQSAYNLVFLTKQYHCHCDVSSAAETMCMFYSFIFLFCFVCLILFLQSSFEW